MKFLFGFIFFVIAVLMSFSLGSREWQLAFIGIATIVGFLFGQVMSLSKQLKELRQSVLKDKVLSDATQNLQPSSQQVNPIKDTDVSDLASITVTKPTPTSNTISEARVTDTQVVSNLQDTISTSSDSLANEDYLDAVNQAASSVDSDQSVQLPNSNVEKINQWTGAAETVNSEKAIKGLSISDKISDAVKGYFTGGNIFVRIGIIILFFGVSFLLKYVSDRGFFPIEYRLIGVVVGAMFLLGLGWRLRHKNETYALLLQGAGIGVLYLDIFAAYNLYQLIPPIAAFALLFIVSMFSAALAVLQDSKSLAVLGFSGGFLAPILASSGSNNHVSLFSYYAVLNIAIVAIAWFKAWRGLNLLGFAFTFIIGTVWGVLSYNSDKFSTTEPFLILFFVFYVLIAVFYALRQPSKPVLGKGGGYVDGTLLFGVPLAASGLQYYLVKDMQYGVSISSFVVGAFYLILAWFIWKRKGVGLKLLSEAFLALGVIFASMAIPFALAPTQTAAAWALEGAGLIWLGSRQNRISVRVFGVLLQIAAGAIYLWRFDYLPNMTAFINGDFISSMMVAVSGILSARLLIKPFEGQKSWEKAVSPALLVWGLIWLIGGFTLQILDYYPEKFLPSIMLISISLLSLFLGVLAVRSKPIWKHALIAAFSLFVIVLFLGLLQAVIALFSSTTSYHPSIFYGWLAWPLVAFVYYFLLYQAQKHELFPRFQSFFHTVLLMTIVLLITLEGYYWIENQFEIRSAWLAIWFAIPAILALWMIIKAKLWPFSTHNVSYKRYSGSILAVVLALWSFAAIFDKGTSDPLPWLPLLNPIDVTVMIIFITLFKWWQSSAVVFTEQKATQESSLETPDKNFVSINRKIFNKRLFVMGFAVLAFLWLNFTLFRVAHHWFAIPYNENAMYASSLVQTAVSILWAFTGVVLTLFASRKNNRLLWVIGAVLLGLVVLKLFIIDLSALGSLGRVISFLVVGILLTSIGYFAPLPDKNEEFTSDNKQTDDQPEEQKFSENGNIDESGEQIKDELV